MILGLLAVLGLAGCASSGPGLRDLDGVSRVCPGNLPPAALQQCAANYAAQQHQHRLQVEAQERARQQAEERQRQAELRRQHCSVYLRPAPETPNVEGTFAFTEDGQCIADLSAQAQSDFALRQQRRITQAIQEQEARAARQRAAAEAEAARARQQAIDDAEREAARQQERGATQRQQASEDQSAAQAQPDTRFAQAVGVVLLGIAAESAAISRADATHDCTVKATVHGFIDTFNASLVDALINGYYAKNYAGPDGEARAETVKTFVHAALDGALVKSYLKDQLITAIQQRFPNDPFASAYAVNAAAYYADCEHDKPRTGDRN